MSQVIRYPASTRADKRIHRVKARRTLRLPRIPRIAFWPGFAAYAVIGSAVVLFFTR